APPSGYSGGTPPLALELAVERHADDAARIHRNELAVAGLGYRAAALEARSEDQAGIVLVQEILGEQAHPPAAVMRLNAEVQVDQAKGLLDGHRVAAQAVVGVRAIGVVDVDE